MKNIHRALAIIALLVLVIIVRSAHAAGGTYYIDYVTGSDTLYDGTTETISGSHGPWKHAPPMEGVGPTGTATGDGCASNCAAHTTVPGDKFIFKGGSVWPNTVFPFHAVTNGSSAGQTYGCSPSNAGCIYYGNATGAGLASWNSGTVNSVTLTFDAGGWNPSLPPTVTLSGGGGFGAAATAYVIPAASADPNIAGFIYHINVTNPGSGYTSAPTCVISGSGFGANCVADIDRAIFDDGALTGTPPHWGCGVASSPDYNIYFVALNGNYSLLSGIEVRNEMCASRTTSGSLHGLVGFGGQNIGIYNLYIHGGYQSCVAAGSCPGGVNVQMVPEAIVLNTPVGEIANTTIENGDSYVLGTSTTAANGYCDATVSCVQGSMGVITGNSSGPISVHNLYLYSQTDGYEPVGAVNSSFAAIPWIFANTSIWLTMYCTNVAGAPSLGCHPDYIYEKWVGPGVGTVLNYNDFLHNEVQGAGGFIQCSTGQTEYDFNLVVVFTGTASNAFNIGHISGGGCTEYNFNNTVQETDTGFPPFALNTDIFSVAATVTFQNDQAIGPSSTVAPNPFWQCTGSPCSTSTIKNQAGSTVTANIQAASVAQSQNTAASQGYTLSNTFAPTLSSNDTVTFASGSNTVNLTSICNSQTYLAPLCFDILGNARPGVGSGWQAGAYQFVGGGGITFTAAPNPDNCGTQSVGVSIPCPIITGTANGGSSNLISTNISGTNAADFSLASNSCVGTISTTCTTQINFTPTLVGPETATLTYTFTGGTNSPQTVTLNGTGASVTQITAPCPWCNTYGGRRLK